MKQPRCLTALHLAIWIVLIHAAVGQASERQAALLGTVTLERPLYVQTGAEAPVRLEAGAYSVAPQDDQHLRLTAPDRAPVIVKAVAGEHDQELEQPFALAIDDPQASELIHLVLLMPDGHSLEAAGSTTGVFPRTIPVHIFTAFAKNWATGSPVKEGLRLEPKTIRAGQDYELLVLPYGICAVLCEREDQCQAFSWRPQPAKPTKGACHLKKGIPPKEADECCVSGVKASAPTR